MIFPYQQYFGDPTPTKSGIHFRPEIPIRAHGNSGNSLLYALVDSGADDTILPLSVGEFIGAKIDHSQKWFVKSVGGNKLELILGEVEFELRFSGQAFRFPAKIGFAANPQADEEGALLGHAGFLDFFSATFDGYNHPLELVPNASYQGKKS